MRRARPLRLASIAAVLLLAAGPADARLNKTELARVAVVPAADARVPLDLAWTDAVRDRPTTLGGALGGRATLMLPVDYTCGNVCDPMLAMSGTALAGTGLVAGRDYSLVLVGIDPRDEAGTARHMLDTELGDSVLAAKATALVGDAAAVDRLTRSLGYSFVYDSGIDGFAHPAAAILLTGDGRVARILSPLALNGRDLRLALVEAGEGRVGGVADRLALLCYGYDAATGVYTPMIRRILGVAAAGTVVTMAIGIVLLSRRSRPA